LNQSSGRRLFSIDEPALASSASPLLQEVAPCRQSQRGLREELLNENVRKQPRLPVLVQQLDGRICVPDHPIRLHLVPSPALRGPSARKGRILAGVCERLLQIFGRCLGRPIDPRDLGDQKEALCAQRATL